MLAPVFAECYRQTGLDRTDIEFWCSGSSDYLAGRAFSFISAVDTIGAVPPISESHVEMDAAWAFFEAYLKIASGQADTALVYGFGKPSASTDLDTALALQLDPYTVTPFWPGRHHIAGLQARAGIDAGRWSETDMAGVAARATGREVSDLLAEPYVADPLRRHACPPVTDGPAGRGRPSDGPRGPWPARGAARRRPAASPRLPTGDRRCGGGHPGLGRPGPRAGRLPGLCHRHRAHRRLRRVRCSGPHRLPLRPRRRRPRDRRVRRSPRSRWRDGRRAAHAVHPPGARPARGAGDLRRRRGHPIRRLARGRPTVLG